MAGHRRGSIEAFILLALFDFARTLALYKLSPCTDSATGMPRPLPTYFTYYYPKHFKQRSIQQYSVKNFIQLLVLPGFADPPTVFLPRDLGVFHQSLRARSTANRPQPDHEVLCSGRIMRTLKLGCTF